MAPRNCLQLLTRVLNQFDTTEQQDQEQWENLLTTLKSNKLTLTETPVDSRYARSTGKRKGSFWDVKDFKITSETDDSVYGTCKLMRKTRAAGRDTEYQVPEEEYAQLYLENIQITNNKSHGYKQRVAIVSQNRTINVESKKCTDKNNYLCYPSQMIGTSIETKSSAKVKQENTESSNKILYSVSLCNTEDRNC